MKRVFFFLAFITLSQSVFAQYYNLKVGDPRSSWWTTQGTIDEAVVSIKPHGLFLEYGLYLTFSAKGTNIDASDTLEVVLDFALDEGAMVTDSWLWIYDDISKGKLIDKWTASQIYEDIVDRRKDPSILTKVSATQYQLRVFPMAGNETRKVKITYLMPMDLGKSNMLANIPIEILRTSRIFLNNFDMIAWENEDLSRPEIIYQNPIEFQEMGDPINGSYLYSQLPNDKSLSIVFETPLNGGIYFGKYPEDEENGYYQMAVLPEFFVADQGSNKIAFLVDYESSNTTVSVGELFDNLEAELSAKLSEKDSFNLFTSDFIVNEFNENWLPASQENIKLACKFGEESIAAYSNLLPLMQAGISFVNEAPGDGIIVLITDDDQYFEYSTSNDLLDDMLDIMDKETPFHILDFQNRNFVYYHVGGYYYSGNEYFFNNLSHLTHGSYYRIGNQNQYSFTDVLKSTLNELKGLIEHFELSTSLQEGYTYGKFNLTGNSTFYLNEPIIQLGRYHGSFPLEVNVNGSVDDVFFNAEVHLNESSINSLDSSQRQIWGGHYISDFSGSGTHTNSIIAKIINKSLEYNVLSDYTAFLCLEDTSQYCNSCLDETELVDIEDVLINSADSIVQCTPNPFYDEIVIRVNMVDKFDIANTSFRLFDAQGNMIHEFHPQFTGQEEYIELKWRASENGIQNGFLFFVLQSSGYSHTEKLVLISD